MPAPSLAIRAILRFEKGLRGAPRWTLEGPPGGSSGAARPRRAPRRGCPQRRHRPLHSHSKRPRRHRPAAPRRLGRGAVSLCFLIAPRFFFPACTQLPPSLPGSAPHKPFSVPCRALPLPTHFPLTQVGPVRWHTYPHPHRRAGRRAAHTAAGAGAAVGKKNQCQWL